MSTGHVIMSLARKRFHLFKGFGLFSLHIIDLV